MLRAVRAYDPDHVVTLQATLSTVEEVRPGLISILSTNGGGDSRSGTDRAAFIDEHREDPVDLPGAEAARQRVVEACTPHRRRMSIGQEHDEASWAEITTCSIDGTIETLTKATDLNDSSYGAAFDTPAHPWGVCLSPPADWGGVLGVAVAAQCGVVELPRHGFDPDLEDDDFRSLTWWLVEAGLPAHVRGMGKPTSQIIWQTGAALGFDPGELDVAFQLTMRGLTTMSRANAYPPHAIVSVGDTAEDFALAYAHQRVYGLGVWLPSSWLSRDSTITTWALRSRLEAAARQGLETTVTSSSLTDPEIGEVVEKISRPVSHPAGRIERGSPRWSTKQVQYLAITADFYRDFAIPITRNDAGDVAMVVPCPAPVITEPSLVNAASRFPNRDQPGAGSLLWQIDAALVESETPAGRGLEGRNLVLSDVPLFETTVRDGRDGITFVSEPSGLLSSGMPLTTRLARPRLCSPGLATWANLMAGQQNRTMVLSPAGRRVEIVRRLWGDRAAVAETLAGPIFPVLRRFLAVRKPAEIELPEEEGVVLPTGAGDVRHEPYLTLQGIRRAAGDRLNDQEVRRQTDELLQRSVLRRGLLLLCEQCGRAGFVSIDDLRQVNECPRCQARNDLVQPRWKKPADEPTWYYDLHAVVRDLIAQNGDVPLLLSHHLRTTSRSYADVAELELLGAGKRLAEVDLLAYADGQLITAEAKRPGTMGSSTELTSGARKRVLVAEQLQADQIVLATAAAQWAETTVKAMCHAMRSQSWSRVVPRLRLISGLSTAKIADLSADTNTGETSTWR
ncbi:hypothetical protein [Nucisporomicrobium flavum]|uniref:hypothetical protein n=1 Tax=Nucisporomicrobium flavum TaxID=2785915 RepID=UPI0018F4A890|nr:hypothetical protein [Nucisporomicrobium flavum]